MPRAEDITLYVPARDAEPTLAACLRSIKAQTLQPVEVLVVVDTRSSDQTESIARSSHVRIIRQDQGKLGHARNLAIRQARTRWIACCDADVTLQPDWLEALAAAREGVAAVGGRTEEKIYTPADQWRAIHMPHNWGRAPLRNPFMLVSEALFDRQALLAVGGYREDLQAFEDSDLCQRLRDAGYELGYEPRAEAWHHRGDSVLDVLDLRWKYAEARQRPLLDRFSGLVEKTRVNREYALNSLAKSIAVGRDELIYISILLFFHHALFDLRSLLSKRPLIPPSVRAALLGSLRARLLAAAAEQDAALAEALQPDLTRLRLDPTRTGIEPRGPAQAHHPGPEPPSDVPSEWRPPAWTEYLQAMASAAAAFLEELPASVLRTAVASAAFLRDPRQEATVPPVPRASTETIQRRLDQTALPAMLSPATVARWRNVLGHKRSMHLIGPAAEQDQRLLAECFELDRIATPPAAPDGRGPAAVSGTPDGNAVAAVLHLERFAEPLEMLTVVLDRYRHAVLCYRPADCFLPGLDVLQARDLASAAARCGAQIRLFETLIGTTTLIVERTTSRPNAGLPMKNCESAVPCGQAELPLAPTT